MIWIKLNDKRKRNLYVTEDFKAQHSTDMNQSTKEALKLKHGKGLEFPYSKALTLYGINTWKKERSIVEIM